MKQLAVILLCLAFSVAAQAREVSGITIPETLTIDGEKTPLILNGAGLRTRYTAKIYVAGLYLTQSATTPEAVLDSTATRVMALHLRRNSDSEQIASALITSVARNHNREEMKGLQDRLNQFKLMMPDVSRDEIVFLEFPANGTTRVLLNKNLRGTLPGVDFQRALLKIWLGATPVDEDLKHLLLGEKPKK